MLDEVRRKAMSLFFLDDKMYGSRFIRIGPCNTKGCKHPPTIYIYEPYEWDGMEHQTNPRYMCEQCADKFFVSKGYLTVKEQERAK